MNRLWIQLSLMIGGGVFFVFLMPFFALPVGRSPQNVPAGAHAARPQTAGGGGGTGPGGDSPALENIYGVCVAGGVGGGGGGRLR